MSVTPLKRDPATNLPSSFQAGDTLPDTIIPTTVARISGATTIAVVTTMPGTPDPNTIYIVTS